MYDKVGFRFIFDQDGEILFSQGEMMGDIKPRKEIRSLNYVDLAYGQIDLENYDIVGIDTRTFKPILKPVEKPVETPEQAYIRELEERIKVMSVTLEER